MDPFNPNPGQAPSYPGEKGPGVPGEPLPSDASSKTAAAPQPAPTGDIEPIHPPAAPVRTGSGSASPRTTHQQAEFDHGVKLARDGQPLPDSASEYHRKGYESVTKGAPVKPAKPEPKVLVLHKATGLPETIPAVAVVTPMVQTAPVDDNQKVKITVVEQGKQYAVEGRGAKTIVDFANVTDESLISILIDRLEGFGVYGNYSAHNENAVADLKKALGWLHARTRDRVSRGVEGTSAP